MKKPDSKDSLKEIVGEKVYSVWIEMLRGLVPDGRTHRLSVTVAAMLQFASGIAHQKYGDNPEEDSFAYVLSNTSSDMDDESSLRLLLDPVEKMFDDAKVQSKRTNARGEGYSIAESAIMEFMRWYDMPWE